MSGKIIFEPCLVSAEKRHFRNYLYILTCHKAIIYINIYFFIAFLGGEKESKASFYEAPCDCLPSVDSHSQNINERMDAVNLYI